MSNKKVIWPREFEPANSPVFVHNTIDVSAAPEKVWYWLTNANSWSKWYINASKVKIQDTENKQLLAGTKFSWRSFGANLQSEVKEFEPCERLAWNAKGTGIWVYHAWLIIPTDNGCTIVTEETQHGWACRLGKILMPNRMYKYHQIWLEGLKRKAEET